MNRQTVSLTRKVEPSAEATATRASSARGERAWRSTVSLAHEKKPVTSSSAVSSIIASRSTIVSPSMAR